ncbi:MAG TPA: type II toxin-antitoxin system PemK/MazF family toxin, partial [Solirubrobacteraceae bacterium]|nr:type II toxin-antitoxin system PemK/MazF family toxin [Solirubrobacteraceae bacterium]
LILTRDEAVDRVFNLIVVPATGTVRSLATEVEIGPADGMPIECVLALDNILSAEKAFLTERITTLGPEKMAAVCSALATATSCR